MVDERISPTDADEFVPFRVDYRRSWGRAVIVVEGELDMATAPYLGEALKAAMTGDGFLGSSVMIDLSRVEFIDCSGWSPIVAAATAGEAAGLSLVVVDPSRPVCRLLELLGIAPGIDSASWCPDISVRLTHRNGFWMRS